MDIEPGYRERQDANLERQVRDQIAYSATRQKEREMNQSPDHGQRGHSPLGASGAERWMSCPGSVSLIKNLALPETDEPDYRREGTAMHEAAEHCLTNGLDTWEIVGQVFNKTEIDALMADAIQMYLDHAREFMGDGWTSYIEFAISSPVHQDFYGSLDFGAVRYDRKRVVVRDLKGGEGITVEAEQNPQIMYYAFGIIDGLERQDGVPFEDDTVVDIGIVQPRAFHVGGPTRTWETTAGELKAWVKETLVPAMLRAEMDNALEAGDHCRFCPAKLVCPLLTSLFRAACTANPAELVSYSDASIARSWAYAKAVKFYLTALELETFRRLNLGHAEGFEGIAKLVPKKSNRVFKPGAPELAREKFGPEVFTTPSLKSPAELEKLSPAAKEFVKEYSYHPDTGLTVAAWSDPKAAVKVTTSNEAFGAAVTALGFTKGD